MLLALPAIGADARLTQTLANSHIAQLAVRLSLQDPLFNSKRDLSYRVRYIEPGQVRAHTCDDPTTYA